MKEEENPAITDPTEREQEVLNIYRTLNATNSHKMSPIPVFKLHSVDRGD